MLTRVRTRSKTWLAVRMPLWLACLQAALATEPDLFAHAALRCQQQCCVSIDGMSKCTYAETGAGAGGALLPDPRADGALEPVGARLGSGGAVTPD